MKSSESPKINPDVEFDDGGGKVEAIFLDRERVETLPENYYKILHTVKNILKDGKLYLLFDVLQTLSPSRISQEEAEAFVKVVGLGSQDEFRKHFIKLLNYEQFSHEQRVNLVPRLNTLLTMLRGYRDEISRLYYKLGSREKDVSGAMLEWIEYHIGHLLQLKAFLCPEEYQTFSRSLQYKLHESRNRFVQYFTAGTLVSLAAGATAIAIRNAGIIDTENHPLPKEGAKTEAVGLMLPDDENNAQDSLDSLDSKISTDNNSFLNQAQLQDKEVSPLQDNQTELKDKGAVIARNNHTQPEDTRTSLAEDPPSNVSVSTLTDVAAKSTEKSKSLVGYVPVNKGYTHAFQSMVYNYLSEAEGITESQKTELTNWVDRLWNWKGMVQLLMRELKPQGHPDKPDPNHEVDFSHTTVGKALQSRIDAMGKANQIVSRPAIQGRGIVQTLAWVLHDALPQYTYYDILEIVAHQPTLSVIRSHYEKYNTKPWRDHVVAGEDIFHNPFELVAELQPSLSQPHLEAQRRQLFRKRPSGNVQAKEEIQDVSPSPVRAFEKVDFPSKGHKTSDKPGIITDQRKDLRKKVETVISPLQDRSSPQSSLQQTKQERALSTPLSVDSAEGEVVLSRISYEEQNKGEDLVSFFIQQVQGKETIVLDISDPMDEYIDKLNNELQSFGFRQDTFSKLQAAELKRQIFTPQNVVRIYLAWVKPYLSAEVYQKLEVELQSEKNKLELMKYFKAGRDLTGGSFKRDIYDAVKKAELVASGIFEDISLKNIESKNIESKNIESNKKSLWAKVKSVFKRSDNGQTQKVTDLSKDVVVASGMEDTSREAEVVDNHQIVIPFPAYVASSQYQTYARLMLRKLVKYPHPVEVDGFVKYSPQWSRAVSMNNKIREDQYAVADALKQVVFDSGRAVVPMPKLKVSAVVRQSLEV